MSGIEPLRKAAIVVCLVESGLFVNVSVAREEFTRLVLPPDAASFTSVAISGNYLVAGDPAFWFAGQERSGVAYIYLRNDNGTPENVADDTWSHVQTIGPSQPRFQGGFGFSAAMDGGLLVVGEPQNDPDAAREGRAYVFRLEPQGWVEEALIIPSITGGTEFGFDVALDGDVAVVGAPTVGSGRAFAYRRSGTSWTEEGVLVAADSVPGDSLGIAVGAAGDRAIVGAYTHSGGAGAAYVFRSEDAAWIEEVKLAAAPPGGSTGFGACVGIRESAAFVAAADGTYVFEHDGVGWEQRQRLTPSDGEPVPGFGCRIALDLDVATIGSSGPSAYLFRRFGTTWLEDDRLEDSASQRTQSTLVAVDGEVALVNGWIYETRLDANPPVPAVSEVGTAILAVALMFAAAFGIHRRRKSVASGGGDASLPGPHCQQALVGSLVMCVAACGAATPALFAQSSPLDAAHHPEQLLVQFRPGVSEARKASLHASLGATEIQRYRCVDGLTVVRVPAEGLADALRAYGDAEGVLYAEPDYLGFATVTPDDPDFDVQWGLSNTGQIVNGDEGTAGADIRACDAWDFWTGDVSFRIGIVDTGVAYTHDDLAANMWTNAEELNGDPGVDDDQNGYVDDIYGYDFGGSNLGVNDSDPLDDSGNPGHGTHVAGIACAVGDNATGVAGVNWACDLVAIKVFRNSGHFIVSDVIEAIDYIIAEEIPVSNHSYYTVAYSQCLYSVMAEAREHGLILVVAAANFSDGIDSGGISVFPCQFDLDNIICVAYTDNDDELDDDSNYGATSVDLAAPGRHIYSTWYNGGYTYLSGTSMATPHVSGVIALLWSRYPNMPWELVRDIVLGTVRPLASLDGKTVTGGIVDAAAALECAPSRRCCLPPDGTCVVKTACECADMGGTFVPSVPGYSPGSCQTQGPGG